MCRRSFLSLMLVSLVVIASCDSSMQTDPRVSGTIRGKAKFGNNKPVSNATITLDEIEVGKTNDAGEFSLESPFGQHVIKIFSGDITQTYSQWSRTVTLTESKPGLTIDTLRLPSPVTLSVLSQDKEKIQLKWSPASTTDFREYKLYQNYNEAFDEKLSELLLTRTVQNDTIFTINGGVDFGIERLTPGRTYYFRLFVMNDFGRLGGSNILAVTHVDPYNDPAYKITKELEFHCPATPSGLAFDGHNLWISTVKPLGGYYDPDEIKVMKYDHLTGTVLKEFSYSDYVNARGITFDNQGKLWMNRGQLIAIDTISGAEVKEFSIAQYVNDVTFDGQYILYLDEWGALKRINPANGLAGFSTTLPLGSGWRGIAWRPNEIWSVHWPLKRIIAFSPDGEVVGSVSTNLIDDCGSCYEAGLFVCFLGNDRVAIAKWNTIGIYKIEEI